jgi:hypothetical protein
MAKIVTKKQFNELYECNCGKPLFKFTDTSRNISYARCNYTKEEYDIKKKAWVTSKKQPCDFVRIYHGERPVFKEIQKVIKLKYTNTYDLEKELTTLFAFLMVSNRTSTLDEINLIVRTKLNKEPLKKFESYTDYRDRIFSEKIVEVIKADKIKEKKITTFPGYEYLKSIDHSGFEVKTPVKKTRRIKKPKKVVQIYDELESENENSESDSESDSDESRSSYSSEESDTCSENEEELSENEDPEIYENDAPDDYDSGGEYDYDD